MTVPHSFLLVTRTRKSLSNSGTASAPSEHLSLRLQQLLEIVEEFSDTVAEPATADKHDFTSLNNYVHVVSDFVANSE